MRASWICRTPQPATVLRELWGFDMAPKPVEVLRSSLAKADQNDDRVWLGWANYAILTGQFAEATSRLKRCLSRRPNDLTLWQAQLELAVAIGDLDGFWKAVAHVPADQFDETEQLGFRAWLAAIHHDPAQEESELSRLIECDPGNAKALERLAVLNVASGRHREAEALHRRRDEISQAREKCRQILQDGLDVPDRAHVMSQLSSKLGRTFDAQAWSILAEAGLGARGGESLGVATDSGSPLPAFVMARATALSDAYGNANGRAAPSGPMLGECLADLMTDPRPQPREGEAVAERALALGSPAGSPSREGPGRAKAKKPSPDFVDDAQSSQAIQVPARERPHGAALAPRDDVRRRGPV